MKILSSSVLLLALLLACSPAQAQTNQPAVVLKDAFKNDFVIGAALNASVFGRTNGAKVALVKQQFNSISPENALKWESVHPEPGVYDFAAADRYVQFGMENNMFIIGHNLIWHHQTPDWVFRDSHGHYLNRDALLARMREHIFTVVGRYRGKIGGWDVVNEAVDENGVLRESSWRKIIGDDYLVKAYEFAHEADPQAELYYNDFDLENPAKRKGAIALIKQLQAHGVKITGIGLQSHDTLTSPTLRQVDKTISAFEKLSLTVMITELDVNVLPSPPGRLDAEISNHFQSSPKWNPYTNGLPDSVQRKLARRYADLFSVFLKHRDHITRVTFWGVTDEDSWLNNYPIRGRTDYPLLFDRAGHGKPAFAAVLKTAQKQKAMAKAASSRSAMAR
jgi:endo-1,4-beta-xylanase